MNNKFIIITGMHRSGTSLIASFIESAGVNLGSNLFPPDKGNPRGYFEDITLVKLHNAVLKRNGLKYFFNKHPKPLVVSEEHRIAALQLVQSMDHNKDDKVVGWKDPRASLFLEFWTGLLKNDGHFIVIFRKPGYVLDSLIRRKTDRAINKNPRIGLLSWYVYNKAIDNYLQHNNAILVEMEDVIEHSTNFINCINATYNLDLDQGDLNKFYKKGELNTSGKKLKFKTYLTMVLNPMLSWKSYKLYRKLRDSKTLLN
ncbi:MAG: hypothetical protein JXR19_00935 [Bacteroidia bacterium]